MGAESASPHRERPGREQIEPAALELIRRRGSEIMGTARRYAATPEDADDAYQRGLEILLTKAPSTDEDQLVPWLKTVVKHEAFALKRQRDRAVPVADGALEVMAERDPGLHERAEHLDRLGVGAEALGRLKPQEKRALLLKAQGYSYKQICEITNWTYTKVNRCLTEGRRSFLEGITRIEAGSECERLAPLISKLADDEASAEEKRVLGPHLTRCLACQATLRDYRRAPAAAAELAGSAGLLVALAAWFQGGAASAGAKLQALGETAGAHKAVAIAASTAALAGGGAVAVTAIDEPDREGRPAAVAPAPAAGSAPVAPAPAAGAAPMSGPSRARPAQVQAAPSRSARRRERDQHQGGKRGRRSRPSSSGGTPAASVPAPPGETAPAAPAAPRPPSANPSSPPGLPADGGEFGP